MKIYLIIVLLSIQMSCYSQKDSLFDSAKTLYLPITIDQISFNNLKLLKKIPYQKIKPFLVNSELGIKLEETKKSTKFYIYGKYKVQDKTILIIIIKRPFDKSITSYLLVYSKNLDLIDFTYVGNRLFLGNENPKFSYSLVNYNYLKRYDEFKNNIDFYKFLKTNQNVSFEINDCEEISECTNYKSKLDSLPHRDYDFYKFNCEFFENNSHLLPFKDCSPINYSQMIVDIGGYQPKTFKNYFIDSKRLLNGKTIIFFLNVYDFENFKAIKEIGYLLFDAEGKLNKIDAIASYKIDQKGTKIVSTSKVFLFNDHIQIEYMSEDKEKNIYKID